jgi:hypothetical protein
MAVILHFTDKSGKPATLAFPNRQMADVYARGVKNPTFTDSELWVETNVTRCGTPAQENYKRRKARLLGDDASEREAETYMEAGVRDALLGVESPQALVASAFSTTNVGLDRFEVQTVCACGNACRKGVTACYTCRKYAQG